MAKKAKLEKDKAKTAHYRKLTHDVLDLHHKEVFNNESLKLTTELLDLNPEFYTVWNFRRDVLDHMKKDLSTDEYAQRLNNELLYVMLLLKRYPKCYWIWTHRRWCLFELLALGRVSWEFEFKAVLKLLEMDSRNFHGWQYRRFVVEQIETEKVNKVPPSESSVALLRIQIDEFDYTTQKINQNISNFLAWHNRSKLIPKIIKLYQDFGDSYEPKVYAVFKSPYEVLLHELELAKTGMFMDADDTSVWLYVAWLLTDPLFTDELKNLGKYSEVLQGQLKLVEELNELEKDDHIEGKDNVWCLRTMVLLKGLLMNGGMEDMREDIRTHLEVLVETDPLRKGRYLDQLNDAQLIPV